MHTARLENIPSRIRKFPPELLEGLADIEKRTGGSLFLVGGTVRDWLLGRSSKDIDIAVSGRASECAILLQESLGGGTLVDLSTEVDETVRLVWKNLQVDLSSFREGSRTIEEDLRKRDFTVNALAVPLVGLLAGQTDVCLVDPTGGLGDLQHGLVKHCRGAFVADPVRMLRGYRLCAGWGFRLDDETSGAIKRDAHLIVRVAAERISYELSLIFESTQTAITLGEMENTGLLQLLLPELYLGEGVAQPEFHHLDVLGHSFLALEKMEEIISRPEDFFPGQVGRISEYLQNRDEEQLVRCLKWAALLHDIGKPATRAVRSDKNDRVTFYGHDEVGKTLFEQFARRARWSRADRQLVGSLIEMHMHPFHLCNVSRNRKISTRAALKICRKAGDALTPLFLLSMSDSLASSGEKKPERMEEELQRLYQDISRIYRESIGPVLSGPRLITGRDLIEKFQLTPGPLFSEILGELETARVEGRVTDRESALCWVRSFLKRMPGEPG